MTIPISEKLDEHNLRRIIELLPYILPYAIAFAPHKAQEIVEVAYIIRSVCEYMLSRWMEIQLKGEVTL